MVQIVKLIFVFRIYLVFFNPLFNYLSDSLSNSITISICDVLGISKWVHIASQLPEKVDRIGWPWSYLFPYILTDTMQKLSKSHIFDYWFWFAIFSWIFTFNHSVSNSRFSTSNFQNVCGENVHKNMGKIDYCLFFWGLFNLSDPLSKLCI